MSTSIQVQYCHLLCGTFYGISVCVVLTWSFLNITVIINNGILRHLYYMIDIIIKRWSLCVLHECSLFLEGSYLHQTAEILSSTHRLTHVATYVIMSNAWPIIIQQYVAKKWPLYGQISVSERAELTDFKLDPALNLGRGAGVRPQSWDQIGPWGLGRGGWVGETCWVSFFLKSRRRRRAMCY